MTCRYGEIKSNETHCDSCHHHKRADKISIIHKKTNERVERMGEMANIKFEIIENFGVLSEGAKGWKKELNLLSWNDREPKYDLRDWDADHEKMGKGVTLSKEELIQLREILNGMNL